MAGKLTSKSSTSSKWSSSSTSSRSSSYLEENRESSPSRLLLLKSKLDNDCFVSTIINHYYKRWLLIDISNAKKPEFGMWLSTSESLRKRSQDSLIWNVITTHPPKSSSAILNENVSYRSSSKIQSKRVLDIWQVERSPTCVFQHGGWFDIRRL